MFARITGTLHVECPHCHHVQFRQVRRTWKMRCGEPTCRRTYAFGLALWAYVPGGGIDKRPPDTILGVRKRGGTVNAFIPLGATPSDTKVAASDG